MTPQHRNQRVHSALRCPFSCEVSVFQFKVTRIIISCLAQTTNLPAASKGLPMDNPTLLIGHHWTPKQEALGMCVVPFHWMSLLEGLGRPNFQVPFFCVSIQGLSHSPNPTAATTTTSKQTTEQPNRETKRNTKART